MLDESGGVLDDLIVYLMAEDWFRVVVNAGTRDKDLAWMRACAAGRGAELDIIERSDLAMIAVQGPEARARVADLLDADAADRASALALEPFSACGCGDWFVARTGYTGEDGFEVMLPAAEAEPFWRALAAAGVAPCGLGARDTLRLEAGMNLYGNDMDASTNSCSKSVGCCGVTRRSPLRASATARSRAAPGRRASNAPSRSHACRVRPVARCRWRCAASGCQPVSSSCRSCATAASSSIFENDL
jgi:aminomethyltransferase